MWQHYNKESYTRETLISHFLSNLNPISLRLLMKNTCSSVAVEHLIGYWQLQSGKTLSYCYSLLNFYLSLESWVNFPAKRRLIWFLWKRHHTLFIGVLKSEWNLIWKKCNSSRRLRLHFRSFSALRSRNKKEAENEMHERNAGESLCFFDKWHFS